MNRNVVIGFAQFDVAFGEAEHNHAEMARLARETPDADLLVFPELCASGYDFVDRGEVRSLAEPFGEGPTFELFTALAEELNTTFVFGYAERAGDELFNSCALVMPNGSAHNYRKLHLFSRETELFTPGDLAPPVVETPAGRIGMMVCFDWFFPEVARALALKGAQIIAHPSNLVLDKCQRAMFARSVENRVCTITANRIGTESRAGRTLRFTGASQILDINGAPLAVASGGDVRVATALINPADADDKHVTEHNDLFLNRRIDFYSSN